MHEHDEGQASRPEGTPRPARGALSTLLAELAHAPESNLGAGWESALRRGMIIGRFELVRELGRGGFGVVWEARDTELRRSVAFKAVHASRETPPDLALWEAEIAARLSHPNIVTLHDVGRCEYGPYLILELLHGRTVAELLQSEPVSMRDALRIGTDVAKALAHAHAHGIVHRDLNPTNVYLCDDGQVKVLDFGLAHAFGRRKLEGGTPVYMAPEQRRGAPEDERTDVFALGAILFRMLAGVSPFAEGAGVRDGTFAPVLEVDQVPDLGAFVSRMLEDDPVRRPRDGRQVLAELTALQRHVENASAPDAVAQGRARRRPPTRRARRGKLALGAALVAAAGAAAAVVVLVTSPEKAHRASALVRPVQERLAALVRPGHPTSEKTLVVLPFHDAGGARADEAFAIGLGGLVTDALRHLDGDSLRVESAGEVSKRKVMTAQEARVAFGAAMALSGNVRWEQERVTVVVRVVDAASQAEIAAFDVQARRGEVAGIEQALVERFAEALGVTPRARPAEPPAADRNPAPGAYEEYVRGRGYLQRPDRAADLASAIAAFDRALARDPSYALAHAGRAEASLRRYEATRRVQFLADARASAERAVSADERLAPARITMGRVLLEADAPADAARHFERAVELEPGNASAQRELARAYDAAGRDENADAIYRRAARLRPGSWVAARDLAAFYERHGRLGEALPLYQRVVELTPDSSAAYADLGGLYVELGMHDPAVAALERSLAMRPMPRAYASLGAVAFREGRYADAVRAYRSAVELDPGEAQLWGDLGDARRAAGDRESAARDYRRAVALCRKELAATPWDAQRWARLAANEAYLGRRGPARAALGNALRLDGGNGRVLFRVALAYEALGERDRALATLGDALDAGASRQEIADAPSLAALRRDPRWAALTAAP